MAVRLDPTMTIIGFVVCAVLIGWSAAGRVARVRRAAWEGDDR
jgi:hypothetical protein